MALRGNPLITTLGGALAAVTLVAEGYRRGGGTPRILKKGEQPDPDWPVFIFTNSAMQQKLDEEKPGWRNRGWEIINNTAESKMLATYARTVAAERGTPLPDGGSSDR